MGMLRMVPERKWMWLLGWPVVRSCDEKEYGYAANLAELISRIDFRNSVTGGGLVCIYSH